MGDQVNLTELLAGSVDDAKARLASVATDQLAILHWVETNGQNRTTMLAAIDAESKSRDDAKRYSESEVAEMIGKAGTAPVGTDELTQQHEVELGKLRADHADEIKRLGDEHAETLKQRDARIAELEGQLQPSNAAVEAGEPIELPAKVAKDFALQALTSETQVVVVDDRDVAIHGLPPLSFWPPQFEPNGDHVLLTSDIDFPIELPRREISGAFLMVDGKPIARASLVQPFAIGAGRPTKLPGRTLSFATS